MVLFNSYDSEWQTFSDANYKPLQFLMIFINSDAIKCKMFIN